MTVETRTLNGIGGGGERRRAQASPAYVGNPPFELPPAGPVAGNGNTTDTRTLAQLSGFNHNGQDLDQTRQDAAVRLLLRSRDLAAQVSAEAASAPITAAGGVQEGTEGAAQAITAYLEIQNL